MVGGGGEGEGGMGGEGGGGGGDGQAVPREVLVETTGAPDVHVPGKLPHCKAAEKGQARAERPEGDMQKIESAPTHHEGVGGQNKGIQRCHPCGPGGWNACCQAVTGQIQLLQGRQR
jgi:hypothetical protein